MWKKLKGSRITEILIGMLIGGILVGCGAAVQQAKASSNEYNQYLGSNTIDGDDATELLTYKSPDSNTGRIYVIKSRNNSAYKYNIASYN